MTGALACSLLEQREAEQLPSVGCVQELGQRGGLGGLPVPLVVVCAGGMRCTCFCSWFFRSGSWPFRSRCLLWSIICPSAQARRCHETLQFFVTRGVVGPGARPASERPSLSPSHWDCPEFTAAGSLAAPLRFSRAAPFSLHFSVHEKASSCASL